MCILWLVGLIKGDGYFDDRHVEIYNSSEQILQRAVMCLKRHCDERRIKVDIYTNKPDVSLIEKWSSVLVLEAKNIRIRENTSPWKSRTEKIRLRVASKILSNKLRVVERKKGNIRPLLKGLFDAEASVDIKGYIEFKQKACVKGCNVVEEVHYLLKSIGIGTTEPRIKRDNLNNKSDCYIYVKDLIKFKKEINFTDSEKRKKIEILIRVKKDRPKKAKITGNLTLWEMMEKTCLPYHKLRGMRSHLTVRQTR